MRIQQALLPEACIKNGESLKSIFRKIREAHTLESPVLLLAKPHIELFYSHLNIFALRRLKSESACLPHCVDGKSLKDIRKEHRGSHM